VPDGYVTRQLPEGGRRKYLLHQAHASVASSFSSTINRHDSSRFLTAMLERV
jgi:hypothetical protein